MGQPEMDQIAYLYERYVEKWECALGVGENVRENLIENPYSSGWKGEIVDKR